MVLDPVPFPSIRFTFLALLRGDEIPEGSIRINVIPSCEGITFIYVKLKIIKPGANILEIRWKTLFEFSLSIRIDCHSLE